MIDTSLRRVEKNAKFNWHKETYWQLPKNSGHAAINMNNSRQNKPIYFFPLFFFSKVYIKEKSKVE